MMFTKEPKSQYFGYFYKKLCRQELSKSAKSGHTALNLPNNV